MSASRITFLAVATSFTAVASLQSLIIPVLSTIGADLGADAVGQTWMLTAWLISAAVATPLLGRAGDLVGRRRMYLLALGAVAVGSLLSAFAPNLTVMLFARVLQGLGAAVFPLGFGLVRDAFPPARLAGAIGGLSAIMAVGSGLGTVIAGPVSAVIGWRGLFALPLVLAATGLVLGWFGLARSTTRATGRINVLAAVLLSGWLVALLLPLSSGNQWGWGSPIVLSLFVVAAILAAAWVAVELRSRNPLVDMKIMRLPAVWTTNATALLTGAAMFGVWAYLPRLAETPTSSGYGLGVDASTAGLIMLPMLVTMASVGFVAGPLSRVLPFAAQLTLGAFLSALASLGIAFLHDNVWTLAAAAAVLGLGTGLVTSSTPNLIVRSVPADQVGIATGMNANIRTIGGAIGTTVFAAAIGATLGAAGLPAESGYVAAFVIGAVLALVGGLVPFFGRSRPVRPEARAIPVIESPLEELAEAA
ncbi:MFS transporter [Agromyces mariniharenae]|uniref:MFS transporter n=1 Tax=Agromyces mariniharenae TaxID=2604423 RepID=A0A5S4V6C6_9MICO|nr:MFS transporter [Agromyces mariniharenae]TYL52841.1 MFS transporter [Agromyces mariniharenae]